jgi:hypothetical protein
VQAQQRGGGFRRFVQTPYGKAALPAATILIVFGTYVYISTLLAIPAILVFGLAIPIWTGLKRPRYLALSGLVVILIVAPISTAALVQEIRTPIGDVSSSSSLPDGNGNPVLNNAAVSPYTGTTSTNFTWQVTVQPQYIPDASNNSTLMIALFVSTCPGATSNSTTYCPSGFTFYNFSKPLLDLKAPTNLTWSFVIGTNGIWDWQMELWVVNATHGLNNILLQGDPTYNGIEGPVVGSWWVTYGQIVPTLYLNDLLLLGLPFYLVLVLYMFFKRRERTRKDAQKRAAGPTPPDSTTTGPPSGTTPTAPVGPSASPTAQEHNCPSCGAVLYAGETSCWKCGAKVGDTSAGTPLPSAPKG